MLHPFKGSCRPWEDFEIGCLTVTRKSPIVPSEPRRWEDLKMHFGSACDKVVVDPVEISGALPFFEGFLKEP